MKSVFLLIICLSLLNCIFSQTKAKEYFLQRSKNQKTTAWILLGAGVTAIITGVIVDNALKEGEQSFTGGFIEVGGIICTLTSVPFFISSSRNKRRATTLAISNEKVLFYPNSPLVSRLHPTFSLHIPFVRN
jgi:hypothetical protein